MQVTTLPLLNRRVYISHIHISICKRREKFFNSSTVSDTKKHRERFASFSEETYHSAVNKTQSCGTSQPEQRFGYFERILS